MGIKHRDTVPTAAAIAYTHLHRVINHAFASTESAAPKLRSRSRSVPSAVLCALRSPLCVRAVRAPLTAQAKDVGETRSCHTRAREPITGRSAHCSLARTHTRRAPEPGKGRGAGELLPTKQRVRPNLVPCPNLVLFASTPVCCAGRPATRYRAAREHLPRVPTAFQCSKCVRGELKRREYQVKARYQVRADACYCDFRRTRNLEPVLLFCCEPGGGLPTRPPSALMVA